MIGIHCRVLKHSLETVPKIKVVILQPCEESHFLFSNFKRGDPSALQPKNDTEK
jgi:hypothetical protein